jgi:hypothetical protein
MQEETAEVPLCALVIFSHLSPVWALWNKVHQDWAA